MTVILFTCSLPNPIANELQRQGHHVIESLSISETLSLQEQHPDATIVINHDVDHERAQVVQKYYPATTIQANTTVQEIIWELANRKGGRVH